MPAKRVRSSFPPLFNHTKVTGDSSLGREEADYYEILGVPRDASDEQIAEAIRELEYQYRLERLREMSALQRAEVHEYMKLVQVAALVLSDPVRRQAYDERLHKIRKEVDLQESLDQVSEWIAGNKWEEAYREIKALCDQNPGNSELRHQYAVCAFELGLKMVASGRHEESEGYFNACVNLNEKPVSNWAVRELDFLRLRAAPPVEECQTSMIAEDSKLVTAEEDSASDFGQPTISRQRRDSKGPLVAGIAIVLLLVGTAGAYLIRHQDHARVYNQKSSQPALLEGSVQHRGRQGTPTLVVPLQGDLSTSQGTQNPSVPLRPGEKEKNDAIGATEPGVSEPGQMPMPGVVPSNQVEGPLKKQETESQPSGWSRDGRMEQELALKGMTHVRVYRNNRSLRLRGSVSSDAQIRMLYAFIQERGFGEVDYGVEIR
jgi:hypothetical protein